MQFLIFITMKTTYKYTIKKDPAQGIILVNAQDEMVPATDILNHCGNARVFAFDGKMGAGKTTFIKCLCEAMGTEDIVNSPTFAIVNVYEIDTTEREEVYHFDCYRIKDIREAMDFGAEEIEFYTLNYPKTIGQEWEIENALHEELEQVRKCMPTRILFLDASNEVLLRHKENDNTRSRNFFEHHLKYLLPLKRKWFIGKENVDVLNVDNLNADEVGKKVKEWVDFCIEHY